MKIRWLFVKRSIVDELKAEIKQLQINMVNLVPLSPPRLPQGVTAGDLYTDEFGRTFRWVQIKGQGDIQSENMIFQDQIERGSHEHNEEFEASVYVWVAVQE